MVTVEGPSSFSPVGGLPETYKEKTKKPPQQTLFVSSTFHYPGPCLQGLSRQLAFFIFGNCLQKGCSDPEDPRRAGGAKDSRVKTK